MVKKATPAKAVKNGAAAKKAESEEDSGKQILQQSHHTAFWGMLI